ncbi:MAG TPA: pseudouridine synthase [Rhodocyclaceae bacterium]
MSQVILLNKPYGVLTQFTDSVGRPTLKDYVALSGVYAAGRLDSDSEGLVVLTDDGGLQAQIASPRHKMPKIYFAQVENIPQPEALRQMAAGLDLGDFHSQPCTVRLVAEPEWLWPRDPPIRYRAAIPTAWLEITLQEGKNRQVRRMTAKIGHPTLRLIRWAVGPWNLAGLALGQWRSIKNEEIAAMRQPKSTVGVNRPSTRRKPGGTFRKSEYIQGIKK